MPADTHDAPITMDVGSPKILSSPLGREDSKDFNDVADSIWDAMDREAAEAPPETEPPAAPAAPSAPEPRAEKAESHEAKPEATKEPEAAAPPKPKRKAADVEKAPSLSEIDEVLDGKKAPVEPVAEKTAPTEVDLDSLNPHPASSEETKSQFKQLRDAARGFRVKAKVLEKLSPVLAELGLQLPENPAELESTLEGFAGQVRQAKNSPVLPKEIEEELSGWRTWARGTALQKSLTFNRELVEPVKNSFTNILSDIASSYPGDTPENKEAWVKDIQAKMSPEQFDENFLNKCLNAIPDGIARQRITSKVVNMSDQIKTRDRVWQELSQSGSLWNQYEQVEAQRQQEYQQRQQQEYTASYQSAVREESEQLLKRAEYEEIRKLREAALRGDDPQVTERYQKLENQFRDILVNCCDGTQPKRQAALALEVVYLRQKLASHRELEKKLARLEKAIPVYRKTTDAVLKPTAGTGNGKPQPVTKRLSDSGKIDFSKL